MRALATATGLLLVFVASAAEAATSRGPGPVDLGRQANVRIDGAVPLDEAGRTVGRAGDVNGDGRPDLLVGAPGTGYNGRVGSGSAYVVFGTPSLGTIDLADLGAAGFRIDGAAANDAAGFSVSGAGDLNGDGRADILLGAPGADNNGRDASGSAYVVFGKGDPGTVDLAALGSGGFRIDGAASHDDAGASVSGAGDVNGDGRKDILVGAPSAAHNDREGSGAAYVVFGKDDSSNVDLAALGENGLRIDGASGSSPTDTGDLDPGDAAGTSVAGAGDLNGDGRADALVGAPDTDQHGPESGSAYVVFGTPTGGVMDLRTLHEGGFRIEGAEGADLDGYFDGDLAGSSVSGAGDVNADGRPDVVVGAPEADDFSGSVHGDDSLGAAYVVFGKANTRTVDLGKLGSGGFRIDGASFDSSAGTSVASAGDLNGDHRADIVVGAPIDFNNRLRYAGSAYVVFGKRSSRHVDLGRLRGAGVPLDGSAESDLAGWSATGIGDLNGDGHRDVLVGAPYRDDNQREDSGAAYVVYGPFRPDTSRPRLAVRAPSTQRLSVRYYVTVRAACSETCWMRASGSIRIVGQKLRLGLSSAAGWVVAHRYQKLELALSGARTVRLDRLLKHGEKARAAVIVRGEDRAGNATTASRTVTLTR